MMKQVLLVAVLLVLAQAEVGKKCRKTNKVYPEKTSKRPGKVMASAKCNMFDLSCCTLLTEYIMYEHTNNFTDLVFTRVALRLAATNKAIADNSLTPVYFGESFNNLIQKKGDVSYQELAREALKHYIKDTKECYDHELTDNIVGRIIDPIRFISNRLKAVYKGLETIKRVLEVITEYKLSDKCKLALMKNGVATSTNMKNSMCQICDMNTVAYKTCSNTCKNVVRGCISDLTELEDSLNNLAHTLDRVHFALKEDLEKPNGALKLMEDEVNIIFDYDIDYKEKCDSSKPALFIEKESLAQSANFSGKPLELASVLLKSSEFVCILSTSNSNCWTATGITSQDTTSVVGFNTGDQTKNPILPRSTVESQSIIDAEELLKQSNMMAENAFSNMDMFIMKKEEKQPTEIKTEDPAGSDENNNDKSVDDLSEDVMGGHENDNTEKSADNVDEAKSDMDKDGVEKKKDDMDTEKDVDIEKDIVLENDKDSEKDIITENDKNGGEEDINTESDKYTGEKDTETNSMGDTGKEDGNVMGDKEKINENDEDTNKENDVLSDGANEKEETESAKNASDGYGTSDENSDDLDTENVVEGASTDSSTTILISSFITLFTSLYIHI